MTNQEIINKIKEITSSSTNLCDVLEKLYDFNATYKQTSFYKKTKMPLNVLAKSYIAFDIINMDNLFSFLQEKINQLDLSSLIKIVTDLTGVLAQETEAAQEELEDLLPLVELLTKENK